MDATAYSAAFDRRREVPLSTVIRDSAAVILTALLLFAAVFLVARRWAGGLSEPLSAFTLISVGIISVATSEVIQKLNQHYHSATPHSPARFWVPFAALPILAYAVSLPGSSFITLALLWLMIVGQEVRTWRKRSRSTSAAASSRATIAAPKTIVADQSPSAEQPPPANWLDQAVVQQLVYRRTADNKATIEGWVCATFAAGQRTAIVHVAFCPPFAGVPQVEAESLDGPACEIRPTLVLPWGVRWECKLADPATTNMSVVLEFFAAEGPAESTADQR